MPRRACGRTILNLYPSLPEFTQTWTEESPQNPPSVAPMRGEQLAQERHAPPNSFRRAANLAHSDLGWTFVSRLADNPHGGMLKDPPGSC